MRYEKGRKNETRQRIIDVASRKFRKDGIGSTGVAGLMADAGLTHGGFYAHFKSKDDLVREALAASLSDTRDALQDEAERARKRGDDVLEAMIHHYLRPAHREKLEAGCAIAALAPEIARQDQAIRGIVETAVGDIVSLIASELSPNATDQAAKETAWAIFGLMVGTLQLARLTPSASAAAAILSAGQVSALRMAGRETGQRPETARPS